MEYGKHSYGLNHIKVNSWYDEFKLKIGSFCSFSYNIEVFLGGNHRVDWITTYPFGHVAIDNFGVEPVLGHPQSNGDVVIGNDVWIGSNVTIMSGIHIDDGAVIATNSVISKNVGPYEIWGGNPAILIKKRFDFETITFLKKLKWWDFSDDEIKSIIPMLTSTNINSLIEKYHDKI